MKLSFSTKGWHDSSFEDFCNIAEDLHFQGIELHNIHNRLFTDKDGAFHDYTAAATLRRLYHSSFMEQYAQWCKDHGLIFTGHFGGEENLFGAYHYERVLEKLYELNEGNVKYTEIDYKA